MNIKDFPREENPSIEGLILIQQGGVTKHVQIGDLPGNNQEGLTTEVVNALAGKSPIGHAHDIAEVNGLIGHLVVLNAHLNDGPETIKHKISDILDLQTALNDKASINQIGNERKIYQVSSPTNVLPGTVWIEEDSIGNFVEEWTFTKLGQWVAQKEYNISFPTTTGGTNTYIFAFNPNYNYLLKNYFNAFFYFVVNQQAGARLFAEVRLYKPDTTFINLATSPDYTNRQIGESDRWIAPLNLFVDSSTYSHLQIGTVTQPTNTIGYRHGADLNYLLIRK
jgi:hypothetical protein